MIEPTVRTNMNLRRVRGGESHLHTDNSRKVEGMTSYFYLKIECQFKFRL